MSTVRIVVSLPKQGLQPWRPSDKSAPAGLMLWVVGSSGVQPGSSLLGRVGRACGQQAGCPALRLTHPLSDQQGLAGERQSHQGAHSHSAWGQAGIFLVISVTPQGHVRALTSLHCLESPSCHLNLYGLFMTQASWKPVATGCEVDPTIVPRQPTLNTP